MLSISVFVRSKKRIAFYISKNIVEKTAVRVEKPDPTSTAQDLDVKFIPGYFAK